MINDNYIINKCFVIDKNGKHKINPKLKNHLNYDEIEYITNRFNDSDSINESIQRIYYNIEIKPLCPICNKPVKWLGKKNRLLLNTCSLECGYKLRQNHNEEYWNSLYGVNNVFATKQCVKQIKQTKLEKYGDENYNNNKQTVQTCLEKYGIRNGGGSKEALNKIQQTCLKKYGETTVFKVKEIQNKIKQTCLEKYGYDNPNKSPKIKNKIKQTCLEKYGHNSFLQSDEYKKHKIEYKIKRRNTLKIHKKLTQSKSESYIYNLFTHYFKKIECQYYSNLYPFYCDFYIPEIDTYIEYQGYYTHGNHPYNKNDINDQYELNQLIEKNKNHIKPNKNLYYIKIRTWTVNDPNKRKIAKENKLNYIEFWNYNEIIEWLKQYDKKDN